MKIPPTLITLFVSGACILGDYFLKKASQSAKPFTTWEFAAGTIVFALTGVGWVMVLPNMKLASVGVVYGVSTVLFMAALGWGVFDEHLKWQEFVGIAMGIASIVLHSRFA